MKNRIWILIIAVGFALLAFLGVRGFFADSEIWSTTLGFYLHEEWSHHWVFTRPLFYLPLYLFTFWTEGGFETLLAARCLFILNALGILFLVFLIARRLRGTEAGLWTATFLVFHSGFVHQAYRIRSDLLAMSLLLVAIEIYLRKRQLRYLWLPLLATPKGVVEIIAAAPFLGAIRGILGRPRQVILWGTSILVGVSIFGAANYKSLSYFISTFQAGEGSPSYLSLASFSYVIRFVQADPVFYLLFVVGAGWLLWKGRISEDEKRVVHSALILSSMGLLMTEKVPFFIASWIPLQALVVGLLLSRFSRISLGLAALQIAFFAPRYIDLLQRGGHEQQLQVSREVQRFLEEDSSRTYYDTVGLVPGRAGFRYFVGPNQGEWNKVVVPHLKSNLPTLILYSKKAQSLEPDLGVLLSQDYIDLGNRVFVRGLSVQEMSLPEISDLIEQRGQDLITLELSRINSAGERQSSVVVRSSEEVLSLLKTYSSRQLPFEIRKIYFGDTQRLSSLPRVDTVLRFDSEF